MTTAPTAPASAHSGNWSGVARIQECTPASPTDTECRGQSQITHFAVSLTQSGSSNDLTGVVSGMWARFDVRGRAELDGSLVLTGEGTTSTNFRVTLTDWHTRLDGDEMVGAFTFTIRGVAADVATITARLEHVVRGAQTPVPPESRFAVKISEATAQQRTVTSYDTCFRMDNAAPVGAHVKMTVNGYGAGGVDFGIEQTTPAESDISPYTSRSGCIVARELQLSRPLASFVRLRVDYFYADGVAGYVEDRAPIMLTGR